MKKILFLIFMGVELFGSLSVQDIATMRDIGVRVSYDAKVKAHAIEEGTLPSKIIKAKYIDLTSLRLYSIPDWLPKMTNLVGLSLDDSKVTLKDIEKLQSLKKLSILNLSNNTLFKKKGTKTLQEILSSFHLSELYLKNTGGDSEYGDFTNQKSLVKLDLSSNNISKLNTLGLNSLSNLENLNLSKNNLSGVFDTNLIPKSSLVTLDLSHNNISTFTFSGDFPMLESLDISMNKQKMKFDEEYNGDLFLKQLKHLGVNDDVEIPEGIWRKVSKYIAIPDVDPSEESCIKNGGKIYEGVCYANWENAKKICKVNTARLPTIEELKAVIKKCGGVVDAFDKNKNNSHYQNCYKKLGFTSNDYWSSTTSVNNSSYAWYVYFYYGNSNRNGKSVTYSVRCVRSRQ